MIPSTLQFTLTAHIEESSFKELLNNGHSETQILGFIQANCKKVIDWNRINAPIIDMEIEPVIDKKGIFYESERENVCTGFPNAVKSKGETKEW